MSSPVSNFTSEITSIVAFFTSCLAFLKQLGRSFTGGSLGKISSLFATSGKAFFLTDFGQENLF